MGTLIEINDTLKISVERGFPDELKLAEYLKDPVKTAEKFIGKEFSFWNKDERLYHRAPTRVFLVQEIDGKWLYWGNAWVIEQTVSQGKTAGKYRITKIYTNPEFQKNMTNTESPPNKSFFAGYPVATVDPQGY